MAHKNSDDSTFAHPTVVQHLKTGQMRRLLIILLLLALLSCNSGQTDTEADKEKELLEKELELTKKELELEKREKEIDQGDTDDKDLSSTTQDDQQPKYSKPEDVLEALFYVARTQDFSELKNL